MPWLRFICRRISIEGCVGRTRVGLGSRMTPRGFSDIGAWRGSSRLDIVARNVGCIHGGCQDPGCLAGFPGRSDMTDDSNGSDNETDTCPRVQGRSPPPGAVDELEARRTCVARNPSRLHRLSPAGRSSAYGTGLNERLRSGRLRGVFRGLPVFVDRRSFAAGVGSVFKK